MIILGHSLIEFSPIFWIEGSDELKGLNQEQVVGFRFEAELIKSTKGFKCAISCNSVPEILLCAGVGAFIIIVPQTLAKVASALAQEYLFDSKIACIINSEDELEIIAKDGVDMAIFKPAIINL